MTTLVQTVPVFVVAPDSISQRPKRDSVIDAVRVEDKSSWADAEAFTSWITNVAITLRRTGKEYYYLTIKEISRYHQTLCSIMPDDQLAQPDSAHDLVQAYVLRPDLDEFALIHTMGGDGATYCTVKMVLGALN